MEIYDEIKDHIKKEQIQRAKDEVIIRQCVTGHAKIFPLQYGLLWYDEYEPYNYKVIFIDTDITTALKKLQDKIMYRINYGIISSYLFYQIQHIDASLVSYYIVKSSNYPYVEINLHNKTKKVICTISGDNHLSELVHNNLFYLKEYDIHRCFITKLNKAKLRDIYYEIYGKNNLLYTKKMLIKEILDNKKREFIDNY
jgi:hypothetical protein